MRRRPSPSALIAVLAMMCAVTVAAETPSPTIPDDEEYTVMAAVLFPNKPEIPDTVTNTDLFLAQYRDRVRLDGVLGNAYTIAEGTGPGSPLKPDSHRQLADATLIADYNAKNAVSYRLEEGRLARALPGRRVHILPDEVRRRAFQAGGWEAYRATVQGVGDGITWVSRVGFNADRTRAAIHIRHQADAEMGAAYLVFLEKSAKTGAWLLSATVMTRMS